MRRKRSPSGRLRLRNCAAFHLDAPRVVGALRPRQDREPRNRAYARQRFAAKSQCGDVQQIDGAASLRHLVAAGSPIRIVLTQPDRPAGRRRVLTAPPAADAARELGLPVLQPERAGDALNGLRAAGVRAMGICAYGQLIPDALLAALPWVNLHPSALPRWRGAAPVERDAEPAGKVSPDHRLGSED